MKTIWVNWNLPKISQMPLLLLLMLHMMWVRQWIFVYMTSLWLVKNLLCCSLILQLIWWFLLVILDKFSFFVVQTSFVVTLINRVVSWTWLILDTIYDGIKSFFIFFQITLFGADFFERFRRYLSIWLIQNMVFGILTRTWPDFLA